MPYTPPTKEQFRAMVSRDLRDDKNTVFSKPEVDDLVNFGLTEVSRIYPVPTIEVVDITRDGNDYVNRQYVISCEEVFRVEVFRDGHFREQVPQSEGISNSGWDAFGSALIMPSWLLLDDLASDSIHVWGYQPRENLQGDLDVAEVDPEAEMGVRLYATLSGYQKLQNDRAQFQQWLAIPGNNDISATQLDGMTNTYLAQWSRHRNHMRTIRR